MGHDILLKIISERYQGLLGDNLVGIYIHGSIAFGCFNWDRSDIDFLVVVENPISKEIKLELLSVLEELCEQAPEKGFEMSVVLNEYCKKFIYPTPYELHFSNDWRLDKYLQNPLLLCNIETDNDLAAHFTVIKNVGLVLYGEPIVEIFGNVPEEDYLDSICLDIENAKNDVLNHPVYFILNLCRTCAYIKDGMVLSKEQGGQWGLNNLPPLYHSLILNIMDNYTRGIEVISEQNFQIEFCEYMLAKIKSSINKNNLNFREDAIKL